MEDEETHTHPQNYIAPCQSLPTGASQVCQCCWQTERKKDKLKEVEQICPNIIHPLSPQAPAQPSHTHKYISHGCKEWKGLLHQSFYTNLRRDYKSTVNRTQSDIVTNIKIFQKSLCLGEREWLRSPTCLKTIFGDWARRMDEVECWVSSGSRFCLSFQTRLCDVRPIRLERAGEERPSTRWTLNVFVPVMKSWPALCVLNIFLF